MTVSSHDEEQILVLINEIFVDCLTCAHAFLFQKTFKPFPFGVRMDKVKVPFLDKSHLWRPFKPFPFGVRKHKIKVHFLGKSHPWSAEQCRKFGRK